MKKIVICWLLISSTTLFAKVKVIVHYDFGRSGNVTYAIAPQEIRPITGSGKLRVTGRPVFYADAPGEKRLQGQGAILFDGENDGYQYNQAYGDPESNQLIEVWVKPRTFNQGNNLLTQVVVSNGNGKEGYMIAQRGKQWILVSGGSEVIVIGDVVKDQWVHLAVVIDEKAGSVWMNGKKTGVFHPTKAFAPNFSIAVSDTGDEFFHGEIHEVRISAFSQKGFNSETDFLLDYKQIKEQNRIRKAERQALVKEIEREGIGKEIVSQFPELIQEADWLISPVTNPCKLWVKKSDDGATSLFQLDNGLISRTFYVSDNIACVSYKNVSNRTEYLRAIKPEARIMLDSVWYEVGGLKGQPEHSYLLDSWYPLLEADEQAFVLEKVETGLPLERYPWKPKYHAVPTDWPAKGLRVEMTYRSTESMADVKDIEVRINYEIYQGIPVMTKWVEVTNKGDKLISLNRLECEVLAVNQDQIERLHIESDYSFALANADIRGSALMHFAETPKPYQAGGSTTYWDIDREYNTWATHNQAEDKFLNFPHHNLLLSRLPMGPDVIVDKDTPFKSFITFELLHDSDDRERKSLGHRRMYKILAPQTTESLLAGGISSHDEEKLKNFIDQMGELGMERLDIQAWPGISHDNLDSTYIHYWRKIAGYAADKGIVMGGYELQVASRGRGKEVDCIHPETGEQGSLFGQSVCIASEWKDTYYSKMWEFFDKTGFMTYNMDGPYHGDPCASEKHPHHRGLNDSQWEQWKTQVEVIHELQRRGMYVPIPDWYFLNGQCATGMGYREASANLTPQQQLLLGRQYIYDGTWHKMPTMGWMTLQLVGFYSNDPRVGLEPLCDHLDRYEQQLIQFLSSGCQLTIRGNRLYDTPETKRMVLNRMNWFKTYRDILTSDIIHISRPTGRDIDCIMHVNPFISHKGMVVVFNPTDKAIQRTLKLPLYYTGLKGKATVTSETNETASYTLNEKEELLLPVKIEAQGTVWFVIEE